MIELLHTVFGSVDVLASREVRTLSKLSGLPPLRTRAMTDAPKLAGLEKVDRPRPPVRDARGEIDPRYDMSPPRVWAVPGMGACTMYARPPYGIAEVQAWIARKRASIPDGRTTRWGAGSARVQAARAQLLESIYIAKRSGEAIPADVIAGAVTQGLMCERCHVRVIAPKRRQCNACIELAERVRKHRRQIAARPRGE